MQPAAPTIPGQTAEATLVVDADQDYVKAIRAALVDVSYVDAVTSISAAVAQLQGRGHRLLILDCGLSGDPTRSEEHTSELQSLMRKSYAVFCLKKKKTNQ